MRFQMMSCTPMRCAFITSQFAMMSPRALSARPPRVGIMRSSARPVPCTLMREESAVLRRHA
jgi:hypothetical protein